MEEISYCGRVTCKTFYLSRGSWAYPYHSFLAIGVDDNVHFYSAVIVILKDFFRRIIQFLREQTFRILLCVFDINNMIFSKNMFIYFETIKNSPNVTFYQRNRGNVKTYFKCPADFKCFLYYSVLILPINKTTEQSYCKRVFYIYIKIIQRGIRARFYFIYYTHS